jgi:hypothetical protein
MAKYIIYTSRRKKGRVEDSFIVSNTLSAKTAKAAFKKKHPDENIRTIKKIPE